ncbi:hypothetical protein Baya_12492 [Bagarius yarrelli]|uniref:Uncharacterized protein n=1 Tax=Bagarius yarrelli TaxID=175774 RepID=A0A556V8I1_BAGYA|nr:hypothetical protein Baya_12492 [Bagarius yarrelli]
MDADKSNESFDCNSPLRSLSKDLVEVLLDISEENLEKQEVCEIPNQTGWDEAIQGWGQCSPYSCLFTAQQRSKKLKPESPISHCVLCTNLKDLNLSENVVPSHEALEASCKTSKEHSRSNVPLSLEYLNRTPSTITATSSSEEKLFDITLSDRSFQKNLLDNNSLFGSDKYTPDKLLSRIPQPDAPYLFLEDRNAGKVALPGRVMVLPPVKVPSKNSHFLRRREGSGDTRPVSEKVGVDREHEKNAPIPYSRPTSQGTIPIFQMQHQYHLLSDLNDPRRYQFPNNTLAETQPSAPSILERNLRQDELIMTSIQHKSGHRSRVGFREKSLRRPEPQLPMLLGTRIPIPVSMQRLL